MSQLSESEPSKEAASRVYEKPGGAKGIQRVKKTKIKSLLSLWV